MLTLGIVFGLISGVLTLISAKKWKKLNFIQKSALIAGIITCFFIAYNSYKTNENEKLIEKIQEKIGTFEDKDGALVSKVEIDNTGVIITDKTKDGVLFGTTEYSLHIPLIKVTVKDNKLNVTTLIHDRTGKVLAAIDENQWELVDDDYDYNNDDTGFELVTKGDRRVFFQIYLKGGIAHILGLILDKDGFGFGFSKSSKDGEGILYKITPQYKLEIDNSLFPPLFKYPRAKHLGERVDKSTY